MSRISAVIALLLGVTFVVAVRCDAADSTAAASAKAAAASSSATPAAVQPKLTVAQREFAAAFVSAANAKDIDALRKLVAPEIVACFTKDTKPFLDRWLYKQTRFAISADYRAIFEAYTGGLQTSPLLAYPAKATDTMRVEFGAGEGQNVILTRQLTREKGKYYLVGPCLTPAGVQRFQAQEKQRDQRIEQARALYDKLEDPLRTQLRTMLKQKKVGEAIKLCSRSLKINSLVARDVLLLLDDRQPN